MKATLSRKAKQDESWPREVQPGRAIVRVYRRKTPSGNFSFMVANYADGERRRFDSYTVEGDALDAADKLARRLDARDYVAASMTKAQALEYANAAARLKPFNVTVDSATAAVAECLKVVGDTSNLIAAARFYAARHKQVTKKSVADLFAEFIKVKTARGSSELYLRDLNDRLGRFAEDCRKDACNVTTADVQDWLDSQKLKPQNYKNFRVVLHTLFQFAVTRGFATDNAVEGVEKVKVKGGAIQIFSPDEIARLLEAAHDHFVDFLPCLALGAFAGLRSAEISRLEWSDIDLAGRHITVGADRAKTATRRVVPICDNLAAWLADYSERQGKIWSGDLNQFHKTQAAVALATAIEANAKKNIPARKPVKWKVNGLRHSYASYRYALINDAGRLSGELGNSAQVIHRHYRELVKPADAQRWFNVRPEAPENVVAMRATAVN
jgi:integrase